MTNPAPAPVDAPVAIVRWPHDPSGRVRARATGTPRLLLIDAGTAPPTDCALDEDWATTAASPADLAARLAALATRPTRPHPLPLAVAADLDDAAVALYDALAARAPMVAAREALGDVLSGAGDLTASLGRLRRALATTGADVLTVPGGLLLAVVQRTR
jgi:hypothetical protein